MSVHEREDRALRLQRVAELLAEAVTPQEVLDAILTEGVRAAEARAGAIGVLSDDGESVELLAQQGYAGEIMEDWARFPVSAASNRDRLGGPGKNHRRA